MSKIIGIDLGTTNSVAAWVDEAGRPQVINAGGERIVPSVVGIDPDGRLLVGTPAKNQYAAAPENTVRSVKRLMGTKETVSLRGTTYTPQEISSIILKRLKDMAEQHTGEVIARAVITVPAYFSDAQRQATKDAGEIAGFEEVRILNEPTAASLVYSLGSRESLDKVVVYDLGGGTFDVSVVEISDGIVEVLATAGNNRLGGDDFDRRIVDHVADDFYRSHGIDLREDKRAMARLTRAAEAAKITLSSHPFARIDESFIAEKDGKPLNLEFELSRERFEHLIEDLLDLTVEGLDQALADAGLGTKDVDKVLLVGGSTRVPAVVRRLEERMGKVPAGDVHPDECVALGAAVQAGIICGIAVDAVLVDVNPYSLGIGVLDYRLGRFANDGYSVIIPRNTPVPVSKSEVYTTVVDDQDTVEIEVFQGEADTASENVPLGKFRLSGIPLAPAGKPEIVVNFDYDVDGIVHVNARDRITGASQKITITDAPERMSEAEKARAQAAVSRLSEGTGLPDMTAALIERARNLALELDGEQADSLLQLADDLEDLFRKGQTESAQETEDALAEFLYRVDET